MNLKSKKGFTLVELLAVVVIIGVIALIATPNILGVLNSSRSSLSKSQETELENAARAWGLKNVYVEENKPSQASVNINTLKEDGALENKSISLKNISNNAGFCIKYKDNQLVYDYKDDINDC